MDVHFMKLIFIKNNDKHVHLVKMTYFSTEGGSSVLVFSTIDLKCKDIYSENWA